MKVFLTGGTGFIGANVVRALLARGDEVVCALRASSPPLVLEGLPIRRVEVDLGDVEALKRATADCDALMHLAGVFDPGPEGAKAMRRVHVDATRAICIAAEKRPTLVCSSSITVGWGSREAPGDEDTPLDPKVYGTKGALWEYYSSKLESERIGAEHGAVIVCPDYILGAWDVKPTSGALVLTMAKRWIPFWPRGGKCFQDADDCALGHLRALERGQPGRRYLLGSVNASYREFMGVVAEVVGQRKPIAPMPPGAVGLAGLVGAVGSRFDPHRFAGLDRAVLRSMQEGRYRSGARAERELGLGPSDLRSMVQKAYDWFKDHGYV